MPLHADSLLDSDSVLFPSGGELTRDALAGIRRFTAAPWSDVRRDALISLSDALLRHDRLKSSPAAVAVGFWLRRANLHELQRSFPPVETGCRVATGLVFHITPANVDTMFVYSWALSFIAGNANIVRLTTRMSPLMTDILDVIAKTLGARGGAAAGNWFVSYEHNDGVTQELSAACDLRIIWGGDETVARIRRVPLNPHAAERAFASKRSFSVVNAEAFLEATVEIQQRLADRMAADITPFGQMACSSPHEVCWIGNEDTTARAIAVFVRQLDSAAKSRVEEDLAASVRRLNSGFAAAAMGVAQQLYLGEATAGATATSAVAAAQPDPCGAGFLMHASCRTLNDVVSFVRANHQTATHFGFDRTLLREFACAAGQNGLDRVVPIGDALAFGPEWDGYSLWSDLTKIVVIR